MVLYFTPLALLHSLWALCSLPGPDTSAYTLTLFLFPGHQLDGRSGTLLSHQASSSHPIYKNARSHAPPLFLPFRLRLSLVTVACTRYFAFRRLLLLLSVPSSFAFFGCIFLYCLNWGLQFRNSVLAGARWQAWCFFSSFCNVGVMERESFGWFSWYIPCIVRRAFLAFRFENLPGSTVAFCSVPVRQWRPANHEQIQIKLRFQRTRARINRSIGDSAHSTLLVFDHSRIRLFATSAIQPDFHSTPKLPTVYRMNQTATNTMQW